MRPKMSSKSLGPVASGSAGTALVGEDGVGVELGGGRDEVRRGNALVGVVGMEAVRYDSVR
jgi:hypothetical protein